MKSNIPVLFIARRAKEFLFCGALFFALLLIPPKVAAQEQLNVAIEGYTLDDWPQILFYAVCNGSDQVVVAWSVSGVNDQTRAVDSAGPLPPGWQSMKFENELAWAVDDRSYGVQPGECKTWFTHWAPTGNYVPVDWFAASEEGGAAWGKANGHSQY